MAKKSTSTSRTRKTGSRSSASYYLKAAKNALVNDIGALEAKKFVTKKKSAKKKIGKQIASKKRLVNVLNK